MTKQTLNGDWKIENMQSGIFCIGTVPGTVISAFCENNIFEDPYFRTNEYIVREAMKDNYKFTRYFDVEEACFEKKHIELVCYGLDTIGTIILNGHNIKKVNNMHRTWRVSCKKHLKKNNNLIEIIFKSPIKHIQEYQPSKGKEISFVSSGVMGGNQYIRKAHSMFGWDWGPQLPDIGIWRDIELQAYNDIRMCDAFIKQIHDDQKVYVKVTVPFLCDENAKHYEVKISIENHDEHQQVVLPANETITHTFIVKNPKLWWPNGYGDQPLYKISIQCRKSQEEIVEEKDYTIGLRTLTIKQDKDKWGNEFAFCVNGIKIFTKGANYIPEDSIYPHITTQKLDYLTDCAIRANYNCLRIWGGGYYPSDYFYDLCDRKGLIIWQDFMFACNIYDLTKEFEENIVAEVYDNVQRLHHHACLGMWCGNNEIESAWENWGGFKDHSKKLRADYIKLFEYILPKAMQQKDDMTFYWPSSPSSGGSFDKPDSSDIGDVHYWEVWHGLKPFSEFQNHYFRFCSEFGFQSFPAFKTVKTYTSKEDWNIFSKVMESHQKNDAANGKILYYLSELFLYPKDFDSMLYISQILQGLAIKAGVEHWRNNRGRCMGALYWQMNDNWPVASWSSIDYYGRWKALHYMAKKFYAPFNATIVRKHYNIMVYLQNETLHMQDATITINLKTFDFHTTYSKTLKCTVDSLSAIQIYNFNYEDLVKEKEEQVFLECIATFENGYQIKQTEVFLPYKHLHLQKPDYFVNIEEFNEEIIIEVKTNTYAPFLELDFINLDAIFSDNYFDITSEEGAKISIAKADIKGNTKDIEQLKQELTTRSLYDSFI